MTAEESYLKKAEEIKQLLTSIRLKLKKHKKGFLKNPKNWGYFGDLEHTCYQLRGIDEWLK